MTNDRYDYRLRIKRNYVIPEVRFDVLMSAVPIHGTARLDDSTMPHSFVVQADRLQTLLTTALGGDEASRMLNEAMCHRSVEMNVDPSVSAKLKLELGKVGK